MKNMNFAEVQAAIYGQKFYDEVLPVDVGPAIDWALCEGFSEKEILIAAKRDIPSYFKKVREHLVKKRAKNIS